MGPRVEIQEAWLQASLPAELSHQFRVGSWNLWTGLGVNPLKLQTELCILACLFIKKQASGFHQIVLKTCSCFRCWRRLVGGWRKWSSVTLKGDVESVSLSRSRSRGPLVITIFLTLSSWAEQTSGYTLISDSLTRPYILTHALWIYFSV